MCGNSKEVGEEGARCLPNLKQGQGPIGDSGRGVRGLVKAFASA